VATAEVLGLTLGSDSKIPSMASLSVIWYDLNAVVADKHTFAQFQPLPRLLARARTPGPCREGGSFRKKRLSADRSRRFVRTCLGGCQMPGVLLLLPRCLSVSAFQHDRSGDDEQCCVAAEEGESAPWA
jgi:hypothetical protein